MLHFGCIFANSALIVADEDDAAMGLPRAEISHPTRSRTALMASNAVVDRVSGLLEGIVDASPGRFGCTATAPRASRPRYYWHRKREQVVIDTN